jgi:CO/xanthine dehydrogenase FAD-binding subunit
VYVGLEFGTLADRRFIDLWGLDELRGIRERGRALRIGALATYTELIRSPLVRARLPMLAAASREVGGVQIQNRGTIGGNIANASPAGDTLPVLAAVGAQVLLQSAAGQRLVPFATYYTGYRQSVRRPDEIIAAVDVPRVDGRQWWRKVGTRRAQAISKVMIAAVRPSRPGPGVRIAFGSLGPTVLRAANAEAVLDRGGSIDEAVSALAGDIHPIDDVRSTAEYRRVVAGNLLEQFWRESGDQG